MLSFLGQALLRSPFHGVYLKLLGKRNPTAEYREYLRRLARSRDAAPNQEPWPVQPVISILLPVHNPNRDWIAAAVQSVRDQVYTKWELCICDDASEAEWVRNLINEATRADPRIKAEFSRSHLGISGALNRARELATGSYLAFLDHDDLLSPHALHSIIGRLQNDSADFLYSDEDYVDEVGRPMLPHLKPDWSPELLSNCMYIGHLMCVSRELFDQAGGFRSSYDGAQDYDFALRATELAKKLAHVPEILYHWRQHSRSIAHSTASKPYSHHAGKRALEDAVRRRQWNATVMDSRIPNEYVLRRSVPADSYGRVRIDGTVSGYGDEYLVFLDSGLRPENPDWLISMMAQLQRPEVGVVGAKLIRHDGALEHGGIVLDRAGLPHFPGRGETNCPLWKWIDFTRNVTAVSGACMGIRRDVFERLGGFDSELTCFQDVDFCLRALRAGYQVIFESNAVLRRIQAQPERKPSPEEIRRFSEKWPNLSGQPDPFYNPQLDPAHEDVLLTLASADGL